MKYEVNIVQIRNVTQNCSTCSTGADSYKVLILENGQQLILQANTFSTCFKPVNNKNYGNLAN